jgi:carboxypeptidase C (cathepsin A)
MNIKDLRKAMKSGKLEAVVLETTAMKAGDYESVVKKLNVTTHTNQDGIKGGVLEITYGVGKRDVTDKKYFGWMFQQVNPKTGEKRDPEMQKRNLHNMIMSIVKLDAVDDDSVLEEFYTSDELSGSTFKTMKESDFVELLEDTINKNPGTEGTLTVTHKTQGDRTNIEYSFKV